MIGSHKEPIIALNVTDAFLKWTIIALGLITVSGTRTINPSTFLLFTFVLNLYTQQ